MSAPASAGLRPRVALTIGKFDGVHAGHRLLAAGVLQAASELQAAAAALILHPHPASVLAGLRIPRLSTVRQRCRRLLALGLDFAEPLQFTEEVAALGPEAFLDRLEQRFELAAIAVGPDFAFGRERAADVTALAHLADRRGFVLRVIEPLDVEGTRVSSHGIRTAIEAGRVRTARSLLREPPRLGGTVVHGAARGRELGFPTANLDLRQDVVVPGNGIYAVRARWEGSGAGPRDEWMDGVASIGVRPTFDDGPRSVEVFLIDFDGDLYGRHLDVAFIERQRGEERFERIENLIEQMHLDVQISRRILAAEQAPSWQVVEHPRGPRAHLRGFDMADLCQAAAGSLEALLAGQVAAADGRSWPAAGGRLPRRPDARPQLLSLDGPKEAGDEAAILADWLSALGSSRSASVFAAGAGGTRGLVWRDGDAGPEPAPAELVDGPRRGQDGWLHASIMRRASTA